MDMSEDAAKALIQYETQTVKAIRGMEARTIAKLESEGWEAVSQQTGRLRTEITIRRPKKPTPWRVIGIGGGAAALVIIVLIILGVTGVFGDEDSPEAAAPTASSEDAAPIETQAAEPSATRLAEPTAEPVDTVLTPANNPELAAMLKLTDNCAPSIEAFATKYSGQTIKFDGSIGSLLSHDGASMRYDILIGAGDYSETSAVGPSFQFNDVNTTSDLHYTGSISDSIGVGTNLTVTAEVGDYSADSCLFQLNPVATAVR